jgi:DNA-binding XRE family transcriptional regulator
MSPSALLKSVKEKYPELEELPKAKLRMIEKALVFANRLGKEEELLSENEHEQLMHKLSPRGISPANSLKAYRLRQGLTQKELAKKTGIAQANLSAMEKGRRSIGLEVAKKLALALNCDFKKFVC